MRYTRIPENTFKSIALNAGVIARDFDPSTGDLDDADIIGATTGGTSFTASPSFADFGEDIDNCPKNTMELKRIETWEVSLSGTLVTIDTDAAKALIGAVEVTDGTLTYDSTSDTDIVAGKTYYTRSGSSPDYVYTPVASPVESSLSSYYELVSSTPDKLEPRRDIKLSDFGDVWWIGDYSDKNSTDAGGFVAIHVKNALNTGGFQIQSSDQSKANFAYEFTGHYSISDQDTVPFDVYMAEGVA